MTAPPSRPPRPDAEVDVLVHALEVHQAELELQNQELIAGNEELRRSNAELAFARDRYRALQELAPAPLITIDRGGVLLEVNHAAEVLTGIPRRGLVGRRLGQLVAERARPMLPVFLDRLFASGSVRELELVLAPDDAAPLDVLVDGVVLPDDGPPRAVLGLVDVSARKRVFAGGVAHGFNNLLTIVLAGTDHALRTLGADAPVSEALREVRRAARSAGDLAYQMLAHAGHPGAAPRPARGAPRSAWRGTGTVLIVDDDAPVRRAIARVVEQLGFAVVTAGSGAEALERFGATGAGVDVVLMDLTMPGGDGVALARAIRARSPAVPIVLVTGYGEMPPHGAGLFAALLAKPFDVDAMQAVLERLVPIALS